MVNLRWGTKSILNEFRPLGFRYFCGGSWGGPQGLNSTPSEFPQGVKSADGRLAASVKVCGWRPHEGGAADTGADVRKPPREETAEGVARSCVRRYGDFDAGGLLVRCVECLFGTRPMKRRAWSTSLDMRNRGWAAEIERYDGYRGWREGEHDPCWSRAGEADGQYYNVAAHRF